MKKAITILALILLAAPLGAGHGDASSRERDPWIGEALSRLVETGWLPETSLRPDLTNEEVAELVARASERFLAQAPSATATDALKVAPGTAALVALVREYRVEMRRMLVDLLALERRILALPRGHAAIRELMKPYLTRNGSELTGYSRGYLNTHRGYGPDTNLPPVERLGAFYVDLGFKSLPVPFVLFEAQLRGWHSFGFIYAEPINPVIEVRRLSLTCLTRNVIFTGGDYDKSLSRLVLWNPDTVHQPVEPTSFRRRRLELEDLTWTDRAPDWRLRGMDLTVQIDREGAKDLSRAWANAFGGPIEVASAQAYSSYYAGARAGVTGLSERLTLAGNALALWDDRLSADAPYFVIVPQTYARRQWSTSFDPAASVTVVSDVAVDLRAEVAHSVFVDDIRSNSPTARVAGWAGLGNLSVRSRGVSLSLDYHDVRPEYYAPGSQTLRYTPASGVPGYQSIDEVKDKGIIGYRDRFLFRSLGRPAFAPYSPLVEMIFPYGDATPNRRAMGGGLSAGVGANGWVKPRVHYTSASEIRPNWVRDALAGVQDRAADFNSTTAVARTFTGLSGALELSLKDPLPETGLQTFVVGYKTQESDFPGGGLKVDTLTLGLDAVPPLAFFDRLLCSLAYQGLKARGSEFTSGGFMAPAYRYDPSVLGTFSRTETGGGWERDLWAAGLKYAITSSFQVRTDWFHAVDRVRDLPDYDSRNDEWRVTYEATF